MTIPRLACFAIIAAGAALAALSAACSIEDIVRTETTPAMQARGAPPTVTLSKAGAAQAAFEKAVKSEGEQLVADDAEADDQAQAALNSLQAEFEARAKAINDARARGKALTVKKINSLAAELGDSTSIFKSAVAAAQAKVESFSGALSILTNPAALAAVGLPTGGIAALVGIVGLFTKRPGTDAAVAAEKEDSFNAGQKKAAAMFNAVLASMGRPPIVVQPLPSDIPVAPAA